MITAVDPQRPQRPFKPFLRRRLDVLRIRRNRVIPPLIAVNTSGCAAETEFSALVQLAA